MRSFTPIFANFEVIGWTHFLRTCTTLCLTTWLKLISRHFAMHISSTHSSGRRIALGRKCFCIVILDMFEKKMNFERFEPFAFTHVYLTLMCIGFMMGVESVLWSVACNLSFGSTISFSLLPFFDETAYQRQISKLGISVSVFYIGHVILHILPCVFIMYYPPQSVSLVHVWVAHIIKLLWAYCIQRSIFLDQVYVPLQTHVWYKMWALSFVCHYIPFVYFPWSIR